jgi:hypothetical protein
VSSIEFDTYYSRYLNNIELNPGVWNIAIMDKYLDSSSNIIQDAKDKIEVIIPHRDFIYNNKNLLVQREEISKKKIFFRLPHNELLNYRNNNKRFLYSLGKLDSNDKNSFLKTFFEFVIWLPHKEITFRNENNVNNIWKLPDDYRGITDERNYSCPTYYEDNSGNIILYKNLSRFNEPGFRYDNSTKKINMFYFNVVAKLQELNSGIVHHEFNTISKQYYLIQHNNYSKNFNNLKFQSLVATSSNITDWEAEIYIPENIEIKNNIVDEENNELGDCSGVYSYSFKNTAQNIEFSLGLIGTGELVTGVNDVITNANKFKSYIYIDKDGVPYHADLSKYNILYDFVNKKYNGGFTIRYVFRKNPILETDSDGNSFYVNYVDTYIYINNIYHTKIPMTGEKLNNINFWGVYNNSNNNLIRCPTKIFQSIENSTNIDDVYNNVNEVCWEKYIPSLVPDKNLSVFGTTANSVVIANESFPFYIVHNGEVTTSNSTQDFYLTVDVGLNNSIYLTIEDFKFNYTITDVNRDKLTIELSNDGSTWLKPGVDIDGIEWFYKQLTRSNTDYSAFPWSDNYIYNRTYPINVTGPWDIDAYFFLDTTQYLPNNNAFYIYDTHDNILKYILIKKLKLDVNQLNKHGIDEFTIELSNDNINWEKPNYDWLLNEEVEILDPSKSIILDSNTTKDMYNGDVAYGTNVGENFPVQFLDSGGTTDNYQINEMYEYYFDAGENEYISILIKELRLENNNDSLRVYGANNATSDGNGNTIYNWEVINVSFMKTTPNYNADNQVYGNGNYFPYSKQILNLNLGNNVTDDIIFNTGYRYIKLEFISNQQDNYSGWDFTIYKSKQFLKMGGNIFPDYIENERVLETNYRFIKITFKTDGLRHEGEFEFTIYKKDIYDGKNYGNTLPTTKDSALELAGFKNFQEMNKLKFDYRYIRFKYLRIASNLYNDENRWRIKIDNIIQKN